MKFDIMNALKQSSIGDDGELTVRLNAELTEEITEKAKKNNETAPRFVMDAIHSALKARGISTPRLIRG